MVYYIRLDKDMSVRFIAYIFKTCKNINNEKRFSSERQVKLKSGRTKIIGSQFIQRISGKLFQPY